MTEAELQRCLADPLWRLQNLYKIKTEDEGRPLPFQPRAEQLEVLTSLAERPDEPLYIIKSRRLGMSTAIGLMLADCAAFNNGFQGSLVDQTQADAERKMSEIIRYGLMSMPVPLVERMEFPKRNDGELQVRVSGQGMEDVSRIFAGKNSRGGTNNFLWISEWGPISATDPGRSREIRTGALPSARRGRRVIETTWYGGKGGDLWELVKPILQHDPNAEGRVLFFPWHGDPACVRTTGQVDGELEHYFRELADRIGRTFSQEQKKWYAAKKLEQGIFVKREYPSTLDEAMTAPIEGAIYGDLITRLQAQGAIRPSAVDGSALIHTFWDLGSPVNTVVWYVQLVSSEIRVVDIDINLDLTLTERVAQMIGKGYLFGHHYLPHDGAATPTSGRSVHMELEAAGLRNVRIIPRTTDIWIGINRLRQLMPRMTFRLPACERGVEALANYHTRRESSSGLAQDMPVHDWSSHAADALRMFAEADAAGMLEGGSATAMQSRRGNGGVRVITGIRDLGGEVRVLR